MNLTLGEKDDGAKGGERSTGRLLALTLASIFIVEAAIMLVLSHVYSSFADAVLVDAALLTAAVTPAVYLLLYRPLVIHLKERNRAEEALRKNAAHLAKSVNERTTELESANSRLEHELSMRTAAEARVAERVVLLEKLADLSMTLSGDPAEVFERIARMVGELIGVPVVCLSEVADGELRFMSVYSKGEVASDAGSCPIEGTPCATIERTKDFRVYDDVAAKFPGAPFLKTHNAFSYCGFPAIGTGGAVVSVLCLLDDKPHEFSTEDYSVLRVFAQRVAMEVERKKFLAERDRSAEALARSEDSHRMILDNVNEIIYKVVAGRGLPPMRMEFVSNKTRDILGYDPEELVTDPELWQGAIHPDDLPVVMESTRQVMARLSTGIREYRVRNKDTGRYLWVEDKVVPHACGEGGCTLLGVARDITAHKLSETVREAQVKKLEALRAIDMSISGSLDLRVTLNVIIEQALKLLEVDAVDILLYNRHDQRLQFASGTGFRTDALRHTSLEVGRSFAGRAALERRTVHFDDLDTLLGEFRRSKSFQMERFTTYYGVPLIAKGEVKGVLEIFNRSPVTADKDWVDFLDALAGQAAIAIDNSMLFDDLQSTNMELTLAYDETIEGWARALDLRDEETEGHSQRVTEMTLELAGRMRVRKNDMPHVRRGALLHDIGKMGVPDHVLLKPGKLTEEEWAVMRRHPVHAFNMLSPVNFLRPALDIPYCHHERWDGTGYPRGLKGEQIPLAARIFAVVDIYDAMTSDRPYRPALSREDVLEHIKGLAGTHLDPAVVEKFLEMKGRTKKTRKRLAS